MVVATNNVDVAVAYAVSTVRHRKHWDGEKKENGSATGYGARASGHVYSLRRVGGCVPVADDVRVTVSLIVYDFGSFRGNLRWFPFAELLIKITDEF